MADKPRMTLSGTIVKTSKKAVQVALDNGRVQWVPRRLCQDGADLVEGDRNPSVEIWFLEQEAWR